MRKAFCETYVTVNIILAGIVVLIVLYSGIFSAQKNNYPIPSACIVKPCESTGLSRSFSEIVRFQWDSARNYNVNGIPIFLFFFIQFWLRILFSVLFFKYSVFQKKIIWIDAIFSTLYFAFAFRNFIILPFQ